MAKAVLGFNDVRTTLFGFGGLSRGSQPRASSLRRYSSRPSLSCRAEIYHRKSSSDYWADIESDIELHLKKSIPIRHPVQVFEPMHYLTFAAPRTRAPALCIASCELLGGDRDRAMAAASAIHLVHAASYAHENIPLATAPSYGRFSRPPAAAVQHKFRPNIELLTGDGILPFGFELLARSMENSPENKADRILRVIVEISKASGSQGIINDEKNKQGELHACGAACGAILGGGSEEHIDKLRKFGLYAGMIQGLVHGNSNYSNSNTEMVKKLRALAMEQLASFRITNKKIGDTIYDILEN